MKKLLGRGANAVPTRRSPPAGLLSGASGAALTRVAAVALWVLVGGAFLAGCGAFLTRPTARGPAKVKVPAPTVGPEGFAELYVATFLESGEGDEARLAAFYSPSVQLRDVTPGALYVARTATVDATEVSPRYWSVTVAAEVLIPEGSGYRRAGTRFYQVGVAGAEGSSYVATSLPAEVPSPSSLKTPKLEVGSLERVRPGDDLAVAVERFASAFLAGDGELVRYVAPDAPLRAVTPPPFVAVKVTDLAVRDVVGRQAVKDVLAAVRGTDGAGRVQILHYSLELAQRSGRWEVARLLPGPPLEGAPGAITEAGRVPMGSPPTTPRYGGASALSSSTTQPTHERTARP